MQRTRIKFCGITRPADAIAAAHAGADAIGLIFYSKSSRCVSLEQAREILRALPPMITPVALFVNEKPDKVRSIASALHLRTIQLHGDEPEDQLGEYTNFSVIKAIKCDADSMAGVLQRWKLAAAKSSNLSALLLETAHPIQAGGTGVENDWDTIEATLKTSNLSIPLIAAGGLSLLNVGQVVRRLNPWAVDVSSGIEQSPGIKSVDKMEAFARGVRAANGME